jgi:hypothetical protein
MNWEFMETASSVALPGYAPVDAADVHAALDAIWRDVETEYPGRATSRSLLGISLGAFHTLFIAAAARDPANGLIDFERYVAVNPPVRLKHGLGKLDEFLAVVLRQPEAERRAWIEGVMRKALDLFNAGKLEPGDLLPFSEEEAQFLIGFAFRITLTEIIMCSQSRENLGVLQTEWTDWRRASVYKEIKDYGYGDYVRVFGLPYFSAREDGITSVDELFARCDARTLEAALRANAKLRVFTNEDDFLLDGEDRAWLRDVVGADHFLLDPHGGHLGNLYQKEVQGRIMGFLVDLAPPK